MGRSTAEAVPKEKKRITRVWGYLNGWEGRRGGVFHLAGGAASHSWDTLYREHKGLIDAWWAANRGRDLDALLKKVPAHGKVRVLRLPASCMAQLNEYAQAAAVRGRTPQNSWNPLFRMVGEAAYHGRDDALAKTVKTVLAIEDEWKESYDPAIWDDDPGELLATSCYWKNRVVWGLSQVAHDAGMKAYHKTSPVSWVTLLRALGDLQSPAAVGVASAALTRVYRAELGHQQALMRRVKGHGNKRHQRKNRG